MVCFKEAVQVIKLSLFRHDTENRMFRISETVTDRIVQDIRTDCSGLQVGQQTSYTCFFLFRIGIIHE